MIHVHMIIIFINISMLAPFHQKMKKPNMFTSRSIVDLPFLILVTIFTALFSLVVPSSCSFHHHRQQPDRDRLGKDFGFTANLIHRDHPESPFYNPNLSKSDRIKAAVQRDRSRYSYLSNPRRLAATPNSAQAQVSMVDGDYVISYSIGTPPVNTFALLDTASDITWLQCLPCNGPTLGSECYKQRIPIFDASKSTSYGNLTCQDSRCGQSGTKCNNYTGNCIYSLTYHDHASSAGLVAVETLTFGHPIAGNISLLNTVIGCGLRNTPTIYGVEDPPGVIGLNREPLSFISQLAISQFSYCLVEDNSKDHSLIHFDENSILSGMKTPILSGTYGNSYYYVELLGISVGPNWLLLPSGFFNETAEGEGGLIIDTGTAMTRLRKEAYDMVTGEMKRLITGLTLVEDPSASEEGAYSPCYRSTIEELASVAPDLTFHFNGADLVLNKEGTWIYSGEGVMCLAILPTDAGTISVLGSFQQQNVNVGYDLDKKVISFQRMTCNSAP